MANNVLSISLKRIGAQVVGLDDTPNFFVDDSGIETGVLRAETVRSVRRLSRQAVGTADLTAKTVFLRNSTGLVIDAVRSASAPTTAGDIINAVRDAITTAVTSQLASASATSEFAPALSIKKLLSALTFIDDDGLFVLDDLGGVNTDGFARATQTRSARQNFRRLLQDNGDGTLRINTAAGLVTLDVVAGIAHADPAALQTSVATLSTQSSTSSTTKAALPAAARATSLLQQLGDLLVVVTDGTIAIDDTGETTLARANKKRSLLTEVKRLTQSNLEAAPTYRIQLTSGIKWNKVAALDPSTASLANIESALSDPA